MADGRGKSPGSAEARKLGTKFCAETARKAAEKSHAVQREYKTFRQAAKELLSPDVMEELNRAMIDKAMDGDVRAYEAIRDTVGEKPTDTLELSGGAALQVEITVVE